MITVSQTVEKIITRSRYLSEAMSKNLINISSLARYIKPEVEELLQKKVSKAALIMAIKRLEPSLTPKYKVTDIFPKAPEMVIRSNLFAVVFSNGEIDPKRVNVFKTRSKSFLTITRGEFETTIVASNDLKAEINAYLQTRTILSVHEHAATISITLPKDALKTPGVFYFFLKSLAWEGINIVDIISSYTEFTLILDEADIHRAFSVLQSLFR